MVASMQPSLEYITSDLPGPMSEKLDPQGGSTGKYWNVFGHREQFPRKESR